MSNSIKRLIEYIEFQGDTKYKFYKKTGLSNGFLDKNRSIGSDKCEIISTHYPKLSIEWLILGTGDMEKKEVEKSNVNKDDSAINTIESAGIRLAEFVNQKKLSIKDFGIKCDIGYNNTASLLKGSLPIGMQVLHKIKKAFPSINTEWILFGNGSMELNSEPLIIDISKDIDRLEQTNNLLLDALKDKEKTISSLEDQVQMLKEWKDLKSLEENPIKSNMGK